MKHRVTTTYGSTEDILSEDQTKTYRLVHPTSGDPSPYSGNIYIRLNCKKLSSFSPTTLVVTFDYGTSGTETLEASSVEVGTVTYDGDDTITISNTDAYSIQLMVIEYWQDEYVYGFNVSKEKIDLDEYMAPFQIVEGDVVLNGGAKRTVSVGITDGSAILSLEQSNPLDHDNYYGAGTILDTFEQDGKSYPYYSAEIESGGDYPYSNTVDITVVNTSGQVSVVYYRLCYLRGTSN